MKRILYLHGFASGSQSAKATFFRRYLGAAGCQVEVPDLAAGDFEHLTITGQLRVIEFAAGGAPLSLIGSSMGGYLAALYAARHPEVERLVLLAPAFGFPRRWISTWGEEGMARWKREGSAQVFHYGEQRNLRLDYGIIEDSRNYEEEPAFPQPALIFHGRHDTVVPVQTSVDFAARHPNVRLDLVDSDHELRNVLEYMAPKAACFLL